jgi:hypothetical protein
MEGKKQGERENKENKNEKKRWKGKAKGVRSESLNSTSLRSI